MAASGALYTGRRLLQLWRIHAKMDLVFIVRDARTVATFALSDALTGIAAVTGMLLLAARFHGIGRWTTPQLVFMLGYGMLATGLSSVLFNYNVAFISRRIGRGQLDHTLIQPQPIWLALLTEGFAPFSALMELVPGLALLLWAIGRVGVHLSPGWVALLALNLAASAAVALSYAFMWGSLAFWAPRAAEEINSATWRLLDVLKPFPFDGLGGGMVAGLLTVVPIGLLAWYPCRALLGLDHAAIGPFGTPLAAIAFLLAMIWLFRRGMQHYGHTGSQRYLSWGHRR